MALEAPQDGIDSKWLAREIGRGGSSAITARCAELIRSGVLAPGSRLPTVKAVAEDLGVGAGQIATAWASLRLSGLIETRRRGGTVVAGQAARTPRTTSGEPRTWARTDLIRGVADPALLPDLAPALLDGLRAEYLHDARRELCSPVLRTAVEPTWPFPAKSWLAVNGATEGALLAVAAAARERPIIAIEEPVSARILFALGPLALKLLPIPCDDHGPQPEHLREALAQGASAFVYQTRHHNPLGHSVTRRRRDELARVLQAAPEVMVIEDDFLGPLADAPLHSLGERLPGRVVLIRGYCTSFGIDLKTAVVGGPAPLIQQIDRERIHGMATHSRVLQGALAHLLNSDPASAAVVRARGVYRERAGLLRQALRERRMEVHGGDTLVLWVTVRDEVRTLVALAGHGAAAGAGSQCFVTAGIRNRVRIAVTQLPDDPARIAELADIIAQAEGGDVGEDYSY